MTTLEPYPFSWLADAELDEMVAIQERLDAEAGAVYQAMLDQAERHAQDSPRPKAARSPVRTVGEPSFDANDGAVQLLALHEAGHAVIAQLFGLGVTGVELLPSADGLLGCSWITFGQAPPFHRGLVLLAGPVAEARAKAGPAGNVLAFLRGNAVEVSEAADLVGDGLHSALRHTASMVRGSWPRIESLARRLLRGGSLDERPCLPAGRSGG